MDAAGGGDVIDGVLRLTTGTLTGRTTGVHRLPSAADSINTHTHIMRYTRGWKIGSKRRKFLTNFNIPQETKMLVFNVFICCTIHNTLICICHEYRKCEQEAQLSLE